MSREGAAAPRSADADADLAIVLAGLAAGALISFTLGTSVAVGTLLGGVVGRSVALARQHARRAR